MSLSVVILAAGQGKRMHSETPKVLHSLGGRSLLEHVVRTAHSLDATDPIIIFGHEGDVVKQALDHLNARWIKQDKQLGTGHAVLQALPEIEEDDRVLILYGDVPLISPATLKKFIATTPADALGIITANFPDPTGLGRIIRDDTNQITKIIEDKDADDDTRKIFEINSGIYLIPAKRLQAWLPRLTNDNMQKEYYLTDIIAEALKENIAIHSYQPEKFREVLGVNDRLQLAVLERFYQFNLAEKYLQQGITIMDPARFDVRGDLQVGRDTLIDINFIAEGHVKIGTKCLIGPNVMLKNVIIGDNVEIKANSVLDGAEIASHCTIGPFARLRPGTILNSHAHIGNFVEIKNSDIGAGSKVNHLSYVGDAEIGKQVNIGAGTITCNYDGVKKHRTIIGDNAFIGSNTQLVAPVTIGEGATIGAGSTITRDAPAHGLTLTRAEQRSIANWSRSKKKEV